MVQQLQLHWNYLRALRSGVWLLLCVCALTLLGLVVLSSATQSFSNNADFFYKQLIWLFVATVAGVTAALVDLEKLRSFTLWIGLASVAILVAVLIPGIGVEVNGARRWIDLYFMRWQVSEFAKLGMVFVLAHYLSNNQREIQTFFKGFFIPCAWIGVIAFLILLEPDFGTAFLCGTVGCALLFAAGVRLLYLAPSLLGAVALFAVAIYHDPVRLARITSFLDVEGNKSDGAYQLWQGILAFGAGGWSGVGLGNGRQQMSFLPEAHTDFIFPIIGEELGFIFTGLVVLLFIAIAGIGLYNLRRAPNVFQFSIALGALLFIILQAVINIGVVTGSMPTKGMSLPFISYGGSNLVLMFLLCGTLFNCYSRWSQSPLKGSRELS